MPASAEPDALDRRQNAFHDALARHVNGRAGRDASRALAEAYPALRDAPAAGAPQAESVAPYAGENVHVLKLARLLRDPLADDLLGAYVHGSVGSGEAVAYSDLDALVILRHAAFETPQRLDRVARRLREARRVMFAYDPLQHHGWFVLTEADLARYCEAYFPRVLFRHAKAILPGMGGSLPIVPRDSAAELREGFDALAGGVARRLAAGPLPRDLYGLKNLLSQFMLLPALYVQVRDGVGVWKADSFEAARPDFAPETWASMDAVSRIREAWAYRLPRLQRLLYSTAAPWRRRAIRRWPVPVPSHIETHLGPGLREGMARLVAQMQQRLGTQEATA